MKYLKVQNFAILLLVAGVILGIWFLVYGGYLSGSIWHPDAKKAKNIQPFFSGLVVPLFTLGSGLLVYENFRNSVRQNFSGNFFKLLEMHHKLRDGLSEEIAGFSEASDGRNLFDDLCFRIFLDYYSIAPELVAADCRYPNSCNPQAIAANASKTGKELLTGLYDYYFHIHHSSLGHYFRNLFYLVKYVDDSRFAQNFKNRHIKILRAQLSNYELLLLSYNCLHDYGERFYPLVEKYELLKSLNNEKRLPEDYIKRIIDTDIIMHAYPHLKLFSSINLGSKVANYPTYFIKKRSVFGKTVSLFVYSNSKQMPLSTSQEGKKTTISV